MKQKNKRDRDWWDNVRIGKEYDGRKKLTEEDKEKIKDLYYKERWSINSIARTGICSKRMVQFILFPERKKRMEEQKKQEKRWKRYYDTKKRREEMRKHRQKLKKLNKPLKK